MAWRRHTACEGREKILPQRGEQIALLDVRRRHRDDRQLESIGAGLPRLRRGRWPPGVAGTGDQIGPRKLADGPQQCHPDGTVRRELVLEKARGQDGQPPFPPATAT